MIPGLKFGQDYYDDLLAKYTHKKELFLKGLDRSSARLQLLPRAGESSDPLPLCQEGRDASECPEPTGKPTGKNPFPQKELKETNLKREDSQEQGVSVSRAARNPRCPRLQRYDFLAGSRIGGNPHILLMC